MNNITTTTEKFAVRIRFERVKRNLSQDAFAEKAGIGKTTLHQIEAKKTSPTLDTVEKLAKACDMEPYELLNFKNIEI